MIIIHNETSENLLQETYFGRRPEFEAAEKLIDRIRVLIRTKKYTGTITDTKENKQLEEIFRKVFGFKAVHILWIDEVVPNAYTILSSFVHRGSKESKYIVKDKKKGYYDTGHSDILFVSVYNSLLNETDLTTEEFMGVVLHEIGHNFDYSAYTAIDGIVDKIVSNVNYFNITPEIKEALYKYQYQQEEFERNHNYTKDIYKEYLELRDQLIFWDRAVFFISFNRIKKKIVNAVKHPLRLTLRLITRDPALLSGKKKENFADSFATAYGYGSGCMSGLLKLDKYPKSLKNSSKFVKILFDIAVCRDEISQCLFEEHGTNHERISLSIQKLERDLKTNDFPPEMKKDLEKELEKLKELHKKILSYNEEEFNYVSSVYRKIIEFLFKGTNIWHVMFPKNQA